MPSGQKLYYASSGDIVILNIEPGVCIKYRRLGEEQGRIKIQVLVEAKSSPSFSKEVTINSGETCEGDSKAKAIGKLQMDITLIGQSNSAGNGWLDGYVEKSFENP
jgi:hypothetical protein